jgi:hypothetical protein
VVHSPDNSWAWPIAGARFESARLGDNEKLEGFRRLERFVRTIETELKPEANFEAAIAHKNAISRSVDGRSVFDDKPRQGSLF